MARVVQLLAGLGPWAAVRGLLYPIAMLGKLLKGYRYQFSIFTPFTGKQWMIVTCLIRSCLPWVNAGLCLKHMRMQMSESYILGIVLTQLPVKTIKYSVFWFLV